MASGEEDPPVSQWEYNAAPDLDAGLVERLREFPRQPDMLIYGIRSLAALALRVWLRLYHRLQISGREHLPEQDSFIIVCNHTSHLDTLCLLCCVPLAKLHRTFPAAAADYFFSSAPRTLISSALINALPFERETRGAESLSVCAELLANDGNILIIFPEGTRTMTGEMARFRSGIGRLIVGTALPVVPCHLSGGMEAWPKGAFFPRPRRLRLRIGAAQTYSDFPKSKESVQEICGDLQNRVAELGATQL
jgi:1-acyl-sn-glycerol-3-phosphate acyltransferase